MKRSTLFAAILLALLPAAAHPALTLKAEILGSFLPGPGWQADPSPYKYARIIVTNPESRKMAFTLRLNGYPGQARLTVTGQALDPGAQRVYHLPLPSQGLAGLDVRCIDSDGNDARAGASAGEKYFLNIAPVAEWASEKEMTDFSALTDTAQPKSALPPGFSPGGSVASPPPGKNYVSQVEPDNLPDNWLCYTPFIVVFIPDATFKTVSAEARAALLHWVGAGGRLEVYGAAEERTESRLLGTIHYRPGKPLPQTAGAVPQEWKVYKAPAWMSFYHQDGSDFPYSVGRQVSGNIGGLVLATIFCIVAGPVNYFYFRRRGRLRMLLVSLPLLSLGFCLLITGYFVLSKGFTRQGGSFSVTVLDEAGAEAITFTRHLLLSGLYPLGGFTFDREAGFYPLRPTEDRDGFEMDLTRAQALTAGMFIPQVPFHYFTALPHTTRERLVYNPAAATVINGFEEAALGVIVVRDQKVFVTGALAPGAKATLQELTGPEAGLAWTRYLNPAEVAFTQHLTPLYGPLAKASGNYYAVIFKGGQPTAQSGVKIKTTNTRHILFSTLPATGETKPALPSGPTATL